MNDTRLPLPEPGDEVRWVGEHLGSLCGDEPRRSGRFVGTQAAADAALASFDLTGYARRRNEVLPRARRGASGLSPWIRHGHLTLPRVWSALDGPAADLGSSATSCAGRSTADTSTRASGGRPREPTAPGARDGTGRRRRAVGSLDALCGGEPRRARTGRMDGEPDPHVARLAVVGASRRRLARRRAATSSPTFSTAHAPPTASGGSGRSGRAPRRSTASRSRRSVDVRRGSVTPARTGTRVRSGTGPTIHPSWRSRPIRVCGAIPTSSGPPAPSRSRSDRPPRRSG